MAFATDTIFCAAVTVVFVFMKMVFVTNTMLSIPETMVCANERIFFTAAIIFPVNEKMFSGLKTIVFVCHTKDSDTKTMVPDTKTIAEDAKRIVEDTKTIVKDDH